MEKTIKEMAIEAYPDDGFYGEMLLDKRASYIAGAKDVLRDIEKAVSAKEYYRYINNSGVTRCSYTEFVKEQLFNVICRLKEKD